MSSLGIYSERALDLVEGIKQLLSPAAEVGSDRPVVVARVPVDLDMFYPASAWNQGPVSVNDC